MTIALISPKGVGMGQTQENQRTNRLYQELANIESLKELMSCPNAPLLAIASLVTPYFDDIVYIDEELDEIHFDRRFDIVGMSFMTQQATRAYELADKFREQGVYTVCGGMHPTNSPELTLQHFDTVFIGEGEVTWNRFILDFNAGMPKRIYRNDVEIDMTSVPIPRYDLVDLKRYKTIPVQISRGCPHNCSFCASTKVYGPKYRHKNVQQVLNELEIIQSIKAFPLIYFTDDNMLVHTEFSLELLKSLEKMKIKWMSHTDISIADNPAVLERLYASGCRKLVIGFESIEPASLQMLEKWKYSRIAGYGDAIRKIQSYGIGVWGTFIVGLDGDDIGVFQKVIDFSLNNKLYGAMISVPTPFPGSELYLQLEKENRILTKHWGSYTLWNVVVQPKNMTVRELEDGFENTLRQIYSPQASRQRMEHFKKIYKEMER